ncbi:MULTISPECIES: DUF2393 domain-containing protein [Acidobacterium]|nr:MULTISPECIES: DUF2393 domain-containing protein [Acidobacterium]HCT59704.1 DUF2393 domain-containing protein [Acidobacterium sp.]
MPDPTPSPQSASSMFTPPPREKPSRLPWLIAAGAVLVIVGLIGFYNFSQKAKILPNGEAALAPYASHLTISNVQLSQAGSMVGTATYIDGTITNTGRKTVTGVTVQAVFHDFDHKTTQVSNLSLNLIRTRVPYVDTEPVSSAPIQPGKSAEFRLIADQMSDSWDQSPPELRIVQVDTQ